MNERYLIGGIQQIGVGVENLEEAFRWYRLNLGMDIPVFDDAGEAGLMLPYTGGEAHMRHAILAANLQGGSAFEIWQYTSRRPAAPAFQVQLGDLGVFAARVKTRNVRNTHAVFRERKLDLVGDVVKDPGGSDHFYVRDPGGLVLQIVEGQEWFIRGRHLTGGTCGAVIGVTDVDRARSLYTDILGYDQMIYDVTGRFEDFAGLPAGGQEYRRVLLGHTNERLGPFSRWLGTSRIELVQCLGREPRKIFEDRYWGDLGFIHLCFDVGRMEALREACTQKGFPFRVDSANSFDMGEAAGHFSYIEDPDGTLIEFVETHRVPVIKKLGWYLNLRRRNPAKPLPKWMIKTMSLSRVKD